MAAKRGAHHFKSLQLIGSSSGGFIALRKLMYARFQETYTSVNTFQMFTPYLLCNLIKSLIQFKILGFIPPCFIALR